LSFVALPHAAYIGYNHTGNKGLKGTVSMSTPRMNLIPFISPDEADPDIAEVYAEIQHITEVPIVSNVWQILGNSLCALTGSWQLFSNLYLQGNLPMTLKALILFSVASAHHCRYCGAIHEVTCRFLGIEEANLEAIVQDLGRLTPERMRKIIQFAIRCADEPHALKEEDYAQIRNYGISDSEIVEIISLAAMGSYFDIIAEASKLEVDNYLQELLPGEQLVL
jgi:uncharacterized peroxidase-related enzyme